MAVSQLKHIVIYILHLSAAPYTRLKSEVQFLYRPFFPETPTLAPLIS
jgi:hypothetical protein